MFFNILSSVLLVIALVFFSQPLWLKIIMIIFLIFNMFDLIISIRALLTIKSRFAAISKNNPDNKIYIVAKMSGIRSIENGVDPLIEKGVVTLMEDNKDVYLIHPFYHLKFNTPIKINKKYIKEIRYIEIHSTKSLVAIEFDAEKIANDLKLNKLDGFAEQNIKLTISTKDADNLIADFRSYKEKEDNNNI